MKQNKCFPCNPQLVIPKTFAECFTYEQQINFLANAIIELQNKVEELEEKINNN